MTSPHIITPIEPAPAPFTRAWKTVGNLAYMFEAAGIFFIATRHEAGPPLPVPRELPAFGYLRQAHTEAKKLSATEALRVSHMLPEVGTRAPSDALDRAQAEARMADCVRMSDVFAKEHKPAPTFKKLTNGLKALLAVI